MKKLLAFFLAFVASLFSSFANAAADYSDITGAISGEQAAIIALLIAVAGVLASIYAVKRGAGIGLSAIRGGR